MKDIYGSHLSDFAACIWPRPARLHRTLHDWCSYVVSGRSAISPYGSAARCGDDLSSSQAHRNGWVWRDDRRVGPAPYRCTDRRVAHFWGNLPWPWFCDLRGVGQIDAPSRWIRAGALEGGIQPARSRAGVRTQHSGLRSPDPVWIDGCRNRKRVCYDRICNDGGLRLRAFAPVVATLYCSQPCQAPVSYTHLRAHETDSYLVCRLLLGK